MIEVRDIDKTFGDVAALRRIRFDAADGQVLGLLGPNGAGKTTCLRIITGCFPPTAGAVRIDGLDSVEDSLAVRRRIGYLPETTPLYEEMTVAGYLEHRSRLYGLDRSRRAVAVDRAVERCWLADVRRRRIGHLSRGYRQRVGLASALLHDPPVLILDEPTGGLDPGQIVETRRLIRELSEDKTMILSSHILPEVELTCDSLVILAKGRVRAQGPVGELARRTAGRARYIAEVKPIDADAGQPADPEELDRRARLAFASLRGVKEMSMERLGVDGWRRVAFEADAGAPDLRESIAQAASEAGLLARELRSDAPSLETIFTRLVDTAEQERPA